MKKVILIFSCLLLLASPGFTQSMYGEAAKADVKMKYVYSFEEALQKAKQEKKLVFFHCFADWAVPCHSMNKVVFSDQEFADWMDKYFVNFFIDVTTPEGRPLADKYNAKIMAHYLILDSNGNVVHRIVGGCPLPEFWKRVACALSPKTSLAGMTKSYDTGERSVKFLGRYATVLKYSNEDERYRKVSEEYFAKLKPVEWPKEENWILFRDKAREPEDKMFQYLVEHKNEFAKTVGDSVITHWIAGVYFMPVFRMAIGDIPYEGGKLLDIYMNLKKTEIPDTNPIYIVYHIAKCRGEKNFDRMMEVFEQQVPGMDERTAAALDMSLKEWKELSVVEKKRVVDYLAKRTEHMSGSLLAAYQETTQDMINPEGIQFEDLSFEETLAKARQEEKLVFVDCYTSWCGPCKMMSKQVFTQKYIGEYFKEHFISLKVDMEKGEGPDLAKKYDVKAYPTMLVLTPDGTVKYKILGGQAPRAFMDKIYRSVDPVISYTDLKSWYASGNRSNALMPEYLLTMSDAGELKDQYNDLKDYLNSLKGVERYSQETWKLYDVFVTDFKAPEFQFMIENRKDFITQVEEKLVNLKIEQVIFPVVLGYLKGTNSEDDLNQACKMIREAQLPVDFSLPLLDQIVGLYNRQDYAGIVAFYKATVGKLPNGHTKLNLDILLYILLEKAPTEVKEQGVAYVQKASETVGEGTKEKYISLIEMLAK